MADKAATQKMLRGETCEIRNEFHRLNAMIVQISRERDQACSNFEDVNKRLVASLPAPVFSDRTICERYQRICDSIENWVDTNCDSRESFGTLFHRHDWSRSEKTLIEELLDKGETLKVGRLYAESGTYIAMRIMMRFVFEKFLRRQRWLPGMPSEQEKVLNTSLHYMYDAYPARDAHSRECWRCDTYTSIKASGEYKEAERKYVSDCATQLSNLVTPFVNNTQSHAGDKLRDLLDEAVSFADMVRSCSTSYYLIYQFAPQMSKKHCWLKPELLKHHTVIDAERGISIRSFPTVKSGEDMGSGHILCTIFPALMKPTAKGSVVRLAKGLLLAKSCGDDLCDETRLTVISSTQGHGSADVTNSGGFDTAEAPMGLASRVPQLVKRSWADVAKYQ